MAIDGKQTNGGYSTGTLELILSATTDFSNDYGITGAITDLFDPPYVNVVSPLSVSKSLGATEMASGQTETMTITLSNSGLTDIDINSFTDSPIDGQGAAGRTYDGGGNLT